MNWLEPIAILNALVTFATSQLLGPSVKPGFGLVSYYFSKTFQVVPLNYLLVWMSVWLYEYVLCNGVSPTHTKFDICLFINRRNVLLYGKCSVDSLNTSLCYGPFSSKL